MMRDGLRSILDLEEDLDVVAEAGNGYQALEMAQALRPDVIVMDIGMKDLNGIEATRQIKARNPQAKVVALSTYSDESYVLSMLEAGASGFVLKDAAVDEMRRAIRAVAAGQSFLSPEVAGSVVASLRGPSQDRASASSPLAPRERQILQLLAEGHTSAEIARRLHIATTTVESHRRNIMKKLDLHSVSADSDPPDLATDLPGFRDFHSLRAQRKSIQATEIR
jgi:two-component system NarL family response regulator